MNRIILPRYLYVDGAFQTGMGVLTRDGEIADIRPEQELKERDPQAELLRLENQVLLPGTVNAHNHSFQSLLRGIATDRPFLEWRDRSLYRYSPKMTVQDIYTGALFAFAEMMKRGVTCVCDFFYLHNFGLESDEAVIRAAETIGIRLVLARAMYDWTGAPAGYVETIPQAVEHTKALAARNQNPDRMVTILPAPHSLHAASPEMILAGFELAKELHTCYHIHVAEEPFEVEQVRQEHQGLTPVEYLDQLGVVDDRMVIIHGVWLKDSEIELLGARGAKLIYCPSSNLFLADGVTKLKKFISSGVLTGLGSDGACSNNRISVFEEMRMASILQKGVTCDAMNLNDRQVFAMGTKNGGRILELPIGKIQAGYKADFVGIDMDDLSMLPMNDDLEQMLPNLVYSMEPTAVKTVVVNGIPTIRDGVLQKMEEKEIREKIRQTMQRLNAD